MVVRDRPLFTEVLPSIREFVPTSGSVYVRAESVEERSRHVAIWESSTSGVLFVDVLTEDSHQIVLAIEGQTRTLALRSTRQLATLWRDVASRRLIYLDITGLRHHVWAVLLRSAIESGEHVIAVYVEPEGYRPSLTPTEGAIYDLSESISGIAPLPGFASLAYGTDDSCFVPLLGFEGTRVSYLIEEIQPTAGRIVPVIGVPGFLAEYPFVTYLSNRMSLSETEAWKDVRFAAANCPFSLYYALEDIAARFPGSVLKIAPIGTKPHALGAILYAIVNADAVELIYDHPIRKARRTAGTARVLLYHVSSFLR